MNALPTTSPPGNLPLAKPQQQKPPHIVNPHMLGRQWRSSSGLHDNCHTRFSVNRIKRAAGQKVTPLIRLFSG
jgi:hypothetical protein